MPQLKIREMPQDERPREKLLARGADALSNAELIAILLRTGRRGMNVVDVARELLDKYKSFAELSRCSVKELSEVKGIGPAKARVTTSAFVTGSGDTAVTTDGTALSTSLRAVNVGGGARWFTHRHLAISFDVRFHVVSDTGGETPIARTTLVVVTGGMSLR